MIAFKKKIYFVSAWMISVFLISSPVLAQSTKNRALRSAFKDPVTGMEFVLVKGGCYERGDIFGDGDKDERPVRTVCVDDFYIGKYEVTNAEFEKFVADAKYRTTAEVMGTGRGFDRDGPSLWEKRPGLNWKHPIWPGDSIARKMHHPVVQISWIDAREFTAWLKKKTGKNYRLPTEAEWEYAARSGGKPCRYSWGNDPPAGNVSDMTLHRVFAKLKPIEGYDDGYLYTSPVGSFKSNEIGLYDMTGNVWEWCFDWYDPLYFESSPRQNPRGPATGQKKAARGGSWNNEPPKLRIYDRIYAFPEDRSFNVGFRVALPR